MASCRSALMVPSSSTFSIAGQSEKRHLALTDLDRRILVLFFCFNVYNTFLGSVLGGAIFQQMGSLINEPGCAPRSLAAAPPCMLSLALRQGAERCPAPGCCSQFCRYWLQILGAALPSASTYFLNYIIIHALSTNWFRFVW